MSFQCFNFLNQTGNTDPSLIELVPSDSDSGADSVPSRSVNKERSRSRSRNPHHSQYFFLNKTNVLVIITIIAIIIQTHQNIITISIIGEKINFVYLLLFIFWLCLFVLFLCLIGISVKRAHQYFISFLMKLL